VSFLPEPVLIMARKYTAGTVDASAENLKIASLGKNSYAVAISAPTKPDGTLFNPEKAPKKHTSGKLYNSLFVRHWDTLVTSEKSAIWTGSLNAASSNSSSISGKYKLSSLENALKGTGLESPIPPFGGSDNFDISSGGLAFVAKDPELNLASHTKQNLYLALRSSTNSSGFALSKAEKVPLAPNFKGATTNPVFSPDGKSVAFTSMQEDGYESDKNQILLIPDVKRPAWITYFFTSQDGKGRWDRSPSSISWSIDGKTLYLLAEENGRTALFETSSNVFTTGEQPKKLFSGGAPSSIQPLKNGKIFVAGTSLIDNSAYSLYDPSSTNSSEPILISSNSKSGSTFGLSRNQIDEITFQGAENEIHAWVLKPSNFQKGKKYPLAYLIHGGPQGSWGDSW
jgi:dipeptidyl aminopeptidase/acylaminoacyl peptidase